MYPSNSKYVRVLFFCAVGKSLREMDESLSSFGIKQGCKLMMIGKRVRKVYVLIGIIQRTALGTVEDTIKLVLWSKLDRIVQRRRLN